jgi:hypothetical protein
MKTFSFLALVFSCRATGYVKTLVAGRLFSNCQFDSGKIDESGVIVKRV